MYTKTHTMRNSLSILKTVKVYVVPFLILFCFYGHDLVAQTSDTKKTITGKVTDVDNEPLIGVSVVVVGSTQGTITDLEGNYVLPVSGTKPSIRFSYTGFVSRVIAVENKTTIDVVLQEDLQQLEEVVVVGYGIQKKSHLTGSITKVKTEGLDDIPTSRLDQALQGRIAGVQIQNITSEVGAAPQIRVRGMGSISASSEPLVIIDGFPVSDGLGIVNMNDVESIEVLKDAASAAIYGSRAANGVIMITTKQGTINKPKYTLKTSWGIKDAYKTHPIMSAREYVDMRVKESDLLGTKLPDAEFAFLAIDNDTD